jgi:hypothetical protein
MRNHFGGWAVAGDAFAKIAVRAGTVAAAVDAQKSPHIVQVMACLARLQFFQSQHLAVHKWPPQVPGATPIASKHAGATLLQAHGDQVPHVKTTLLGRATSLRPGYVMPGKPRSSKRDTP